MDPPTVRYDDDMALRTGAVSHTRAGLKRLPAGVDTDAGDKPIRSR
jgi:hypothetical protein